MTKRFRSAALAFLLVLIVAPRARGGERSGSPADAVAGIPTDRIEVRLSSLPARTARPLRAELPGGARPRVSVLGVAGVDRFAARWPGVRFEPEFRGETPPPAGSDAVDFTAFWRVLLPPGADVAVALAQLRELPEVASADSIARLRVSAIPNDSLWSVSTWFDQPSGHDVHAPEAWDVTVGDTNIVVAIIDTGVIPYHPDLAAQMWTNWAEANGTPGVDDDHNGYIDDIHGWDFVNLPSSAGIAVGEDWSDEDNDPNDFAGHGTKVAGIVGAATNNTIGVAGTAWAVRLMPLRVGWSETGAPLGIVDMSYVAEALRYATRMGATVVNCSFETDNLGGMLAAASEATRAGVVIVYAAGNGNTPYHALGDREDVISVAASDPSDVIASFSNTGSYVDLAAPGVGVASTFLRHAGVDSIGARQPAYDSSLDGTSFSAPLVAGGVALVQAHRRALAERPYTPMEMVLRMRETADDIRAENPSTTGFGAGRLNLARALTDPPTSVARRTGSRTVGPAVVLPTRSGAPRVAVVTNNSRLLIVDGAGGDTLVNVALPGRPQRQLAAADLGGGYGVALVVSTTNNAVAAFHPSGVPLAGWPVNGPGGLTQLTFGPALGDLDGDGVLEVVCGADDGEVFAWHADGTPVAGFPVQPFSGTFAGAIALAQLDGQPGLEIVALSRTGEAHVLKGDGTELAGWPVTTGATNLTFSPVVARLGTDPEPALLLPGNQQLCAYRPNGTLRWAIALGANPTQEPALGDLDGDGFDDIVCAANASLARVDSAGVMASSANWPLALGAAAGTPVIGPLRAGGLPAVMLTRSSALVAFDDLAQPLFAFPEPGGATGPATLAELDGDGRTEVVAGTGPDSLLYIYDAGAGTWSGAGSRWPTTRGDFARTGSRPDAATLPAIDDVPPATILSLRADSVGTDRVTLHWFAPGDDGPYGQAAGYELQTTQSPASAGNFLTGVRSDLPAPLPSTSPERFVVTGLASGAPYYFAIRAHDASGNVAASSNVVAVTTAGSGPVLAPPGVAALRARPMPTRAPVEVWWQGATAGRGTAQSIGFYDLTGRLLHSLSVGTDTAGVAHWDGRDQSGHRVPAGLYFARLVSGPQHANARIVLLP